MLKLLGFLNKNIKNFSINLGVSWGCAEVVVQEEGVAQSSRFIPKNIHLFKLGNFNFDHLNINKWKVENLEKDKE